MNKKIKILLIVIASVLLLTCCSLGTVFIIKSKNKNNLIKETTYEVSTIMNDKNNYKEYTIKIDDVDTKENDLILKYTENDVEIEHVIKYNEEKECFYFEFYKTDVDRKLSNVNIKYKNVWYNAKDITINKVSIDSIYVPMALETKILYDGCYVTIKTNENTSFNADVYLNEIFVENYNLNNDMTFLILYDDSWLNNNKITLKNINFMTSGFYTDEIVEQSFELYSESSLTYCSLSSEEIYYFEESIELEMIFSKTIDFELQNIVINEKKFIIETTEKNGNLEKINLTIPVDELITTESGYSLNIEKMIFSKGELKINKNLEVIVKNLKMEAEIYVQNDYYLNNEERVFEFYITNPYNLLIKNIEINDERYEINSEESFITYTLNTTDISEVTLNKIIFENKNKEYFLETNINKKVTEIIMPTTFTIVEDILTVNNDKYLIIEFDNSVRDKDILVSFYLDGNLLEINEYVLFTNYNTIIIDLSEEIFEIKEYYLQLNYILLKENNVSKLLYNEETDLYTLTNYNDVKSIIFSTINAETGEIELDVVANKNVTIKEITFEVLDNSGETTIEDWCATVNYNEETQRYVIIFPYDGVRVKITSVSYEKNSITYYTELPIKDEIILV